MSCGRPHATPCTEVIAAMSSYIDGEVGAEQYQLIAVHLTECPPCGDEERVHRQVKALVVRAFGTQVAPGALRARIEASIRTFESPE